MKFFLTPSRTFDQFLIFLSACAFYVNSAFVSYGTKMTGLSAGYFTFARSFIGAISVLGLLLLGQRIERPREFRYLFLRALAYFFALMTFFEGVSRLGPALGNTLNLTYPLFIALFALKTGDDAGTVIGTWVAALLAFVGIVLVLQPSGGNFDWFSSLIGLASGMFGAVAIASLRRSRALNNSLTVLAVLFGLSLPLSVVVFWREIYWPTALEFVVLLSASVAGVAGQYLITFGSKHISATESGVISQSRILIAAIVGIFLSFDVTLNGLAVVGVLIIFSVNVWLVVRGVRSQRSRIL